MIITVGAISLFTLLSSSIHIVKWTFRLSYVILAEPSGLSILRPSRDTRSPPVPHDHSKAVAHMLRQAPLCENL